MKDYYEILGIDELTSKPLVKIAYATAIDYCLKHNLGPDKIKEINEAYSILRSYRMRIRYSNMKSSRKPDSRILQIIEKVDSDPRSGSVKLVKTPSRVNLETRYILKSLIFEIYVFIISVIFSTIGNALTIMSSGVSFISSLLFYFGLINLSANWLPTSYSILAIILSIAILIWFLKSLGKRVIKTVANK